jgi:hypothetical protein
MSGKHFCVSFARTDDLKICLQIGQSLMFDNGAFSAFTRKEPFNEKGYYKWLEPILGHPHWAVIPDVIDGTRRQQERMVARWPFRKELGFPVWHLGMSMDYLRSLADNWQSICFGSSAKYWKVGSPDWQKRMDDAFDVLARRGPLPWVHGLRMLGQGGKRWPLASADSANVAVNFKRDTGCSRCKAFPIDSVQCPTFWRAPQ